ncbi:hypothetical protein R6Q57_013510 [Mikania cordata]
MRRIHDAFVQGRSSIGGGGGTASPLFAYDGAGLQFRSKKLNKFLAAENGGGSVIVANRQSASTWETFRLWRINEKSYQMRVFNKQFLGLDSTGINLVANLNENQTSGVFEIIRKADDPSRVRIKAPNGFFLQAKTENGVTADSRGYGPWRDDDPSVFEMTIVQKLEGEYQVTNGHGPLNAPQIMRDHWDTFIVEKDFEFVATSGLNAVRIPVGWWTASDPTPPEPYVGGSLQYLDKAFLWAKYANNPSLYAVELLNEPHASGVSLDVLAKYYEAGYKAVRDHAPNVFVVLSFRLGGDSKELFAVTSGKTNVVIDFHYYNLYSDMFNHMTAQQNIDFVNTTRANDLQALTTSNGPLIFVGEWVSEWQVGGATKEDFQRFSKAQLQVFGRASFGWAYWSLKHVYDHWSMEWMLKNGYITL